MSRKTARLGDDDERGGAVEVEAASDHLAHGSLAESISAPFAAEYSRGVAPNPVPFDSAVMGSLKWRSHGTGTSTLSAATPGIVLNPVTIRFAPPWAFFSLVTLGGLIGSVLRGRGRDNWPKALGIGVLSALVMVSAYAMGFAARVNAVAPGSAPAQTGEGVLVILGVLAALGGVSFLVPKARLG